MRKHYILWDHDGVLVDTERWYYRANQKALREIGIEIKEEDYMHHMQSGVSVWKIARDQNIDKDIINRQRQKRNRYYQEYVTSQDVEMPDVERVLGELKQNYSMAIVTTAKRADFDIIQKKMKLVSYMEFCLTLEDYQRSKPHPDPYLKAVNRFKADPNDCIVIEDSRRGLLSALAAGVDCVIVKHEFTRSHDFTGASSIVESISDIPELLNNWGRR